MRLFFKLLVCLLLVVSTASADGNKERLVNAGFSSNQIKVMTDIMMKWQEGPSGDLDFNLGVGPDTLENCRRSSVPITIGHPSTELAANITGDVNVAVGGEALKENRYGSDNSALGVYALQENRDGFYNTGVGHFAGASNQDGWKNFFGGAFAGQGTSGSTTVQNSVYIGYRSGFNLNGTSLNNTATGMESLFSLTTGGNNVAIGHEAAKFLTTAEGVTSVGRASCTGAALGNNNSCFGNSTGVGLTTGTGNLILGANVTGLSNPTNNIILATGDGTIQQQFASDEWTLEHAVVAAGYVVASLPSTCTAGAITRATDSDDCSAGSGNGALCACNNAGNGWVLLLNY